ncbi:MAG: helix-turn-helix transcriptional regulator [Acholeplasma sp.]|nr:helix-turn-helix transcriptional regulator [Acholeplasma sp.]
MSKEGKNKSVDLNKLRFEIMIKNVTQKQISEKLDITVQSVSNKLRGKTSLTTDELAVISSMLNKEQSFFLKSLI